MFQFGVLCLNGEENLHFR